MRLAGLSQKTMSNRVGINLITEVQPDYNADVNGNMKITSAEITGQITANHRSP